MGVDGRIGEKPQDDKKQNVNSELGPAIAAAKEFNGIVSGIAQRCEVAAVRAEAAANRAESAASRAASNQASNTADSPKVTRDPLVKGKPVPTKD